MEQTPTRTEGTFFKLVLVLVNAYLAAFAIDGLLSFLDDGLRFVSVFGLGGIRGAVASLVVSASYLVAALLVFVPRLPKTLLLVPVLFAMWADLGAPPFGGMSAKRFFGISMDLVQIAIAAWTFWRVRMRSGFWFLRAESLPPKNKLFLRVALSALVAFAVGVLLLIGAVVSQAKALIESKAGSYMRLTWSGVDLQETILVKKNQKVRLVAMAHIGKPQFYESLYSGFPEHSLVLEEGVSDRKGILAKKFSYQNFAGILGYTQQPSVSTWKKKVPSETASGSGSGSQNEDGVRPFDVVGADVDVSDFSESTIQFLKLVGALYQSRNMSEFSAKFSAFQKEFKPEQTEKFFEEAVLLRNQNLLRVFDARSAGYSDVVIPWGALHMPDLEVQLKKRGFAVEGRRYLPHARYRDFLWKK